MKKYFLILVLGLSLNGFGQQIAPFNKIVTFFSDTGIYNERIYSVVSTDSNYFLLMYVSNDTINSHLILVKTDLYGNKLAYKDLASDTSGHPFCNPDNTLLLDKDTNLLVVSSHWYSTEVHGQVVKLNSNLDIIWDNVYRIPDSLMGALCVNGKSYNTAIRQTPDGGYIINGFYFLNCDYSQNVQKLFLQKIDINGNLEWRKLYPNIVWSFDIEVAADSGFYVTNSSSTNYSTWLEKIDKHGNQQYQILNVPHMSIAHYDSNHIVLAETFWVDISLDKRAIKVAKVNIHNKSIVWKKNYYPARSVRQLEIHQSVSAEVRNGFIYIGSSAVLDNKDSSHVGYKGIMMKLNGDGDSLWSRYYGYDSIEFHELSQFYDFHFHSDNEIVAVGYYDLWNPDWTYSKPGWIVKMDSNGMAPRAQTVSVKELKNYRDDYELIVYPNPASEYITISMNKPIKYKTELIIYNAMGQVVSQRRLNKGEMKINLNLGMLKSGVYFFELKDNNGLLGKGKLVKE